MVRNIAGGLIGTVIALAFLVPIIKGVTRITESIGTIGPAPRRRRVIRRRRR